MLYDACLRASPALIPSVVDLLEFWELAAVFGMARGDREERRAEAAAIDPIKARAQAAKEGRRLDPTSVAPRANVGSLSPEARRQIAARRRGA